MQSAPLYNDLADGPEGGEALWLTTDDDIRIRIGVWAGQSAGTVLLFPGRTEYIEKYGRTARDFAAKGFNTLAIDWRGQGLGARLVEDVNMGFVDSFPDYQLDMRAAFAAAEELDLPKPFFLVGHSMGGCIGLRSLMEELPVKAAAFSAPMWGIAFEPWRRAAAWMISSISRPLKFDRSYAPGTSSVTYVKGNGFEDNLLTTDPDMFEYMQQQVKARPELAIGGPALGWLYEALQECKSLSLRPTPATPTICHLGSCERIVDVKAIHDRMARWSNGTLDVVTGAEHEILMETPAIRNKAVDQIAAHFQAHSG